VLSNSFDQLPTSLRAKIFELTVLFVDSEDEVADFFFHLADIKGRDVFHFIPFIDFKSISKKSLIRFFSFSEEIDRSLIIQ
jgi:hypothetical protein